jgi:hypothetical protein
MITENVICVAAISLFLPPVLRHTASPGHLAANLLLGSMEKKRAHPKSIFTEPKLVVRESSNRAGISDRWISVDDAKRKAKHAAKR